VPLEGSAQAQHARRLLCLAAATAATAHTGAAAASTPAADCNSSVAHPHPRRGAEAAAGGRDGGAVAQQEGGRSGYGRSGLRRSGSSVAVLSVAYLCSQLAIGHK